MPVIFSNYFSYTRSSSLLHLSSVRTSVDTKSTKFKASQLWNTLSERLRKIKNFNSFKTELFNYLIDNTMSQNHEYYKMYLCYCSKMWSCLSCQLAHLSIFLFFCVMCVCFLFFLSQGGPLVGLTPVLAACHLIYVFSVVLHCISIHVCGK